MTVLVLLMTTSLIVVALLGVTINSTATFGQQKASSRQLRVADSALDAAVNSIRMDSTGSLGGSDPCDTGIGTVNIDGLDADVSCKVEPSDPLPLDVPATSPGATNSLKIVGDSYTGLVPWRTNCSPGDPGPGCFPWKDAVGAPNYAGYGSTLGTYPATLVHSGPEPLRVSGGVVVRRAAAVILNPTDDGPGLTVGGDFTQYDKGLFSTQGGGECGLLGYTHPWNVAAARVQDLDSAPLCNPADDATTAAVDESLAIDETAGLDAPAKVFPPAPKANAWMPTVASPMPVTSVARAVPSCSGTVLTFEPGSYNSAQTAILNGYLASDSDGCDGRTFWFKPGAYWFDSNSAGDSMTMSDGSARLVFGEPSRAAIKTAGANASDFPQACDPTKAGVSITLSPRTSLIHNAGRVAICDTTAGPSNSGALPSIWQTAWADGGWTASPGQIDTLRTESRPLVGGPTLRNGANLDGAKVAGDGQVANAPLGCNAIFCQGEVFLSVSHMGAADLAGSPLLDPGSAPISWAQLLISGNSTDANDMESIAPGAQAVANTQIRVFLRDPATGVVADSASCGGWYQAINETPDAKTTLAYDLLAAPQSSIDSLPFCGTKVTDRGQLVDARIDIQFHVNSKCSLCGDDWRVSVDGVAIRTGWDLRATRASNPITGTFENPERVASPDNQSASIKFKCSWWAPDGCDSGWRNVVLHELGNPEVPDLPSGNLTTAGVVVKGAESRDWTDAFEFSAYPKIWDHSKMRLTLSNLAGGGSCAVEYPRTPAWRQSVYLDLLNPSAGQVGSTPRCSTVLTDPSQLVGSDLKLDLYLERDNWAISEKFGVLIDYLGLTTTAGAYTGPASSNRITSNATSSGNGSSFSSFGAVSVAKNSLDISWKGPATPVPLVTGDLVVTALGSEMTPTSEMGVLCCSPAKPSERRVMLKAVVGGRLRASAIVRIGDAEGGVWNPGRSVVVEDWKLCNRPSASATCSA